MPSLPRLTNNQERILLSLVDKRDAGDIPTDSFYVLYNAGEDPLTIRLFVPTSNGNRTTINVEGHPWDLEPIADAGYLRLVRDAGRQLHGRQGGWFCSFKAAAFDYQRWHRANPFTRARMWLTPDRDSAHRVIYSPAFFGVVGTAIGFGLGARGVDAITSFLQAAINYFARH